MYFRITLLFYFTAVHKNPLSRLQIRLYLNTAEYNLHERTTTTCATFDLHEIFHTYCADVFKSQYKISAMETESVRKMFQYMSLYIRQGVPHKIRQ